MLVVLSINGKLKSNVTFSRYTFLNKETGQEVDVGSPEDLMVWEPGQIALINFGDPWAVPDQPGLYELRVYVENRNVASAVFRVE
jgi:hypothetical protein